jgi:nicotinic acid mononucleotide adenylyltransferase
MTCMHGEVDRTVRKRGCYPGTFDPPTLAHLAIAEAAVAAGRIDLLDLVLSREPLGKSGATSVDARSAVLAEVCRARPWLGVRIVDARLIAEISRGYDVLVVGADKWAQIVDVAWYGGSRHARDRALERLPPEVLVAPRPGHPTPPGATALELAPALADVSSTRVREGGRHDWMLPEAARSGLWSPDVDRS